MTFDLQPVYKAVLHHLVNTPFYRWINWGHREARWFAQGHLANQRQSEDPAGLLDSKARVVLLCGTTVAFSRTEENLAILSLAELKHSVQETLQAKTTHGVNLRTSPGSHLWDVRK